MNEDKIAKKRQYKREWARKKRENEKIDKELALQVDFYPTKKKRADLTKDQKAHLNQLLTFPIRNNKDTSLKSQSSTNTSSSLADAKRQLGIAASRLKRRHVGSIDFDIRNFTKEQTDYFFAHLYPIIHKLLSIIDLNDHWTSYYYYDDGDWKQRTIDSFTSNYLKDQIDSELRDQMSWIEFKEQRNSGETFFPVSIKLLTQLRFINEDEVGLRGRANNNDLTAKDFKRRNDYEVYTALIDSKSPKSVIDKFLSNHLKQKRKGAFWKWVNTFDEINLEVFGIFNEINKRTVSLMEKDNCFVYACRKAGLSSELINDMRYCIKKRMFSFADIKRVSNELKITFNIKVIKDDVKSKKIVITPNVNEIELEDPIFNTTIDLILFHNHYMTNRKVYISPYYIHHREEIMKNAKKMKLTDRLMINGKETLPDGRVIYNKAKEPFSIIKVLKALFKTNAFRPIKLNEVYDNMLCFEDIIEDDDLSFDPRLCCKLFSN